MIMIEMGEAYKNTLYAYEKQNVLFRHPNKEYVRGDKRIKEPVLGFLPSEEGRQTEARRVRFCAMLACASSADFVTIQ